MDRMYRRAPALLASALLSLALACADPAPGTPVPACAIDDELVAALRAVAANHGCRLGSLRPLFAAAADRWRNKLPPGIAWFAVLEPGRAGHRPRVRTPVLGDVHVPGWSDPLQIRSGGWQRSTGGRRNWPPMGTPSWAKDGRRQPAGWSTGGPSSMAAQHSP